MTLVLVGAGLEVFIRLFCGLYQGVEENPPLPQEVSTRESRCKWQHVHDKPDDDARGKVLAKVASKNEPIKVSKALPLLSKVGVR